MFKPSKCPEQSIIITLVNERHYHRIRSDDIPSTSSKNEHI